jgi:hypothetical protein
MKHVRITVDGITYSLSKTSNGEWVISNKAPLSEGDYPVTVVATNEYGKEIVFDTTDESLIEILTLLVRDGVTTSGNRMLDYYPYVIKIVEEFKAITCVEGFEIDFLTSDIDIMVNEAYLTTMGESRIKQWEQKLGLVASVEDTLEDRRDKIIATIRGTGKLNTALINSIVSAFTNGVAISYIEDSTLYVKIQPPVGNKQYKFANVEKALKPKVPAHLGLVVMRDYATWGEIKDNFASWSAISQMDDWEAVKLYIAP